MTSSNNIVKTTNPSNDDLFLCRAFAKAVSSDKLLQIIQQQPIQTESFVESISSNDNTDCSLPSENIQWKTVDLCLCRYSEDGLLYKATIIHIHSSSCTVSFDDYGNEEVHPFMDLQIRTEEQEPLVSIDEHDILPPSPFPVLNSNDDDSLSSTLMSWYLAGYHTGFYEGIKDQK